ncbi:MAG: 50S ribosomal protein L35 [Chrysiogenetes bacterium]|nr:50S ribosomal protein L35 [Chrysiogenetes bacterium]
MPKMKTHRGAAKRIRKTGKGKFKFKRAGNRHCQSTHSKSTLRRNRDNAYIDDSNLKAVKAMLPY